MECITNEKFRMQAIAFLEKYNDKQQVKKVIHEYLQADAWIGLSAPEKDMVVLINKEKAEVVKIVDLRPWK